MTLILFPRKRYNRVVSKSSERILSCDPGVKNFAISIVDYGSQVKWVNSFMVSAPITGMGADALGAKADEFADYFEGLINLYRPNKIAIETFMQRSFRSNQASPINFMIGIIYALCRKYKIEFHVLMASQWKKELKKQVAVVDSFYDLTYPVKQRLPNHIIDSIFIGTYHSSNQYKSQSKLAWVKMLEQVKTKVEIPK